VVSIRVLLADDHVLFRSSVAACLSGEPGIELVGEAGDGAQALELARSLRPDVVLMDISMPRMDGLEATRRIKAELPGVRVLVLTVCESRRSRFAALDNGADGFLPKTVPPRVLLAALRGVARDRPTR
jgi:DNA-binding NarL/FixJ family response regulator